MIPTMRLCLSSPTRRMKLKNDKESDWEDQQEGHPTDALSDDQDIDVLDGCGQDGEDRAAEISELSRNQLFG